jgi:hypothetical protein
MEDADQSPMSPGTTRNLPITSKTAIPTNKIWYNGEWGDSRWQDSLLMLIGRSREARIDPDAVSIH